MNTKQQSGFTLIELVMVIVILGVLAATVAPKFVDLGTDARVSSVKALDGAMRDANSMIYAKASVAGQIGATGTVSVAGVSVATVYGFAKDITELKKIMDLSTDFSLDTGTTPSYIQQNGATTVGSTCAVTYAAASSASVPPTYTLATGGC